MKNKHYEISQFKRKLNEALHRTKLSKREYVDWDIKPEFTDFLVDNYSAHLVKYKIDRNSFPHNFDPQRCSSKIVTRIYHMKGQYVRLPLSQQQLSECRRVGLHIIPCVYRIYVQ